MKNIIEELKNMMKPEAALIAYQIDGNHFLELRNINEKGKMGEGKPVSEKFLKQLGSIIIEQETINNRPYGFIPDNLIYCDVDPNNEIYIWHNPPQRKSMFFHKDLGLENGEYNLPGIIFYIHNKTLMVYAYTDHEPNLKTELYHAPFFNIYQTSVCLGNAKINVPDHPTFEQLIQAWEKVFWLSEFSHLGNTGNPTKTNLVLVTKQAKESPFPINELVKNGLLLKNLIQ